jgi:hypothetical protein
MAMSDVQKNARSGHPLIKARTVVIKTAPLVLIEIAYA